jgi:pyruvate dehydrogenase E2 component (dihydrolipoamide acetyltransferase)
MSNEITMPKLSDTMEEGKILRWLKHPGDKISPGEAIAEVETDKADMVLEAFEAGVLDQIKLNEGESAPVGAVIAVLKSSGSKQSKSDTAEDMTSNLENPGAVAKVGNSATPKQIDIMSKVTSIKVTRDETEA